MRRAIDLREGDGIDEAAFKQLICVAVAANKGPRALNGQAGRRKPGYEPVIAFPMNGVIAMVFHAFIAADLWLRQ